MNITLRMLAANRASVGRRRPLAAIALVAALVVALLAPVRPASVAGATTLPPAIDSALDRASSEPVSVIVQAAAGRVRNATRAIAAAGGRIRTALPLIDGFEAVLPGTALDGLATNSAIRAISANTSASFVEYSYDETSTASSFARTSGATAGWARGHLGQGVGVAVIDTGVSPMKDFDGRVVHGPDLSGEGTVIDSYGHGTVMAGIIGGSGADSAGRTGGAYTGIAPKSRIVSVKVAGRNAAVDVSTILQAMHWVAAYKDQYNIRVLNLSWGTKSTQHYTVDPLNYAVQRLWRLGIVVVVAAGNAGPQSGTVTKPGDDPMVITVGSFDDKQNLDPADDSMSAWSSRGPTSQGIRKPDVVAPGRSLVAARSYGSYVEQNHPKALVAPSYIKGSGTSEAAAVVSGLAAQMIGAKPSLTPDQVKAALRGTAVPISGVAADVQGAGRVRLGSALDADVALTVPQLSSATGLGSIEGSRGGTNVQSDCNGDGTPELIQGEIDVRCEAWNGVAWTGVAWTGVAWTGVAWTGDAWTSAGWNGVAWTGGTWNGVAWTGVAWTGVAWTGSSWSGVAWTGSTWAGVAWTGSEWTTAEYEEEEFLTAFWGNRPPRSMKLPGEPSYDDRPAHATHR